jgi:hypothetical protein
MTASHFPEAKARVPLRFEVKSVNFELRLLHGTADQN